MESTPNKKKKSEIIKDKAGLIAYREHLETRIKATEDKKRTIDRGLIKLKQDVRNVERELDSIKNLPLILGSLISMLDEDGRALVSCSTGAKLVVNVSKAIPKEDLMPGARLALNSKTMAVIDVLSKDIDPFVRAMELSENFPDISYDDIGGLEDQMLEARESVELPLIKPELFERVGITPPKGILLYGPPGTGKTLLAKAIAHETNSTFIKIVGSELVQKYIGEGARYVREVFDLAREKAPTILFIDEIDAVAAQRSNDSTSGDREVERTLMQLLNELDGFDVRGDVKIIAATNRIDIIDPALLRPGRFDRLIEVPIPGAIGREEIFKVHLRGLNVDDTVNVEDLVNLTEGATGADIKAVCTEAGMKAIRKEHEIISYVDFIEAIEKVLLKRLRPDDVSKSELFV